MGFVFFCSLFYDFSFFFLGGRKIEDCQKNKKNVNHWINNNYINNKYLTNGMDETCLSSYDRLATGPE